MLKLYNRRNHEQHHIGGTKLTKAKSSVNERVTEVYSRFSKLEKNLKVRHPKKNRNCREICRNLVMNSTMLKELVDKQLVYVFYYFYKNAFLTLFIFATFFIDKNVSVSKLSS